MEWEARKINFELIEGEFKFYPLLESWSDMNTNIIALLPCVYRSCPVLLSNLNIVQRTSND